MPIDPVHLIFSPDQQVVGYHAVFEAPSGSGIPRFQVKMDLIWLLVTCLISGSPSPLACTHICSSHAGLLFLEHTRHGPP